MYRDESPHYLGLIRERALAGDDSYRLVIGRDSSLTYGHSVDVDAETSADGVESADWTAAGVRLQFKTGHRVFVPAEYFVGGR